MRRSRVIALTAAAAGLALAVAVVHKRGGVAYLNVDSALTDARVFYLLVMAPLGIAAASLIATLPRIVALNVAATVAGLLVLEVGVRLFVAAPPVVDGEPQVQGGGAFYVPDEHLGYTIARAATVDHRRTIGGTEIYHVTYRTDSVGRRETPASERGPRRGFVAFFGDSNVFGEGLPQTETLPYFTGQVTPAYRVYNYGVPGYGPAQFLALANHGDLRAQIAEQEGYVAFLLIPAHVSRVVGSSRVSVSWGRHFPYYVEDHGAPARRGDFAHGRALTTLAYFLWTRSAFAERLGIELPLWYTERDYRLTARVLKEADRQLKQRLPVRRSVVVLAQVYDDVQRRTMDGIRDALRRERVDYLDYTGLMDARDPRFRVAEQDYHYSGAANEIIARRLAADLLQAASPAPSPHRVAERTPPSPGSRIRQASVSTDGQHRH